MKLKLLCLISFNLILLIGASVKFTNINCKEFDKSFATITICQLKLVERGVVAMNLHVKLFQVPVNNISVNGQLFKKANGYRPFLSNVTADFCDVMKHVKRFPYAHILFQMLPKYSNINHTCPYDHDIIIKRFVLKDEMFYMLPLPSGDYSLQLKVFAYNDLKAIVRTYLKVSD